MAYRVRASTIGEKAREVLKDVRYDLRVRHVFSNTLYLEAGEHMVILTRKENRSPFTINLSQDALNKSLQSYVSPRDKVEVDETSIRVGDLYVDLENVDLYRQETIERIKWVDSLLEEICLKGLRTVIILYSLEFNNRSILRSTNFREFLKTTVHPSSRGDLEAIRKTENYRILLGMGEGFTPSGDDFILGFISIFNLIDRKLEIPKIEIDDHILFSCTSWVSAMFLKYAQQEIYDDDLHKLLESISLRNELKFTDSLLHFIRKGHTSGLDTSLGIFTGLALIIDNLSNRNLTDKLINYSLNFS